MSAKTAAYKRFGPSEALKPLTEAQLEKLMARMAKNPKRQEAKMAKRIKKSKKSKKARKVTKTRRVKRSIKKSSKRRKVSALAKQLAALKKRVRSERKERARLLKLLAAKKRGKKNPLLMSVMANPGKRTKKNALKTRRATAKGDIARLCKVWTPKRAFELYELHRSNGMNEEAAIAQTAITTAHTREIVKNIVKYFRCNPSAAWHKREFSKYAKMMKGDLKAGHKDAADYWQGAASAEMRGVAASKRNPGAKYHTAKARGYAKIARRYLKPGTPKSVAQHFMTKATTHAQAAAVSRRLGMKNPQRHSAQQLRISRELSTGTKRPFGMPKGSVWRPNPSQLDQLKRDPKFRQALALYRKFHGSDPVEIRRSIIPIGGKKVTGREFFVAMGKAPDVTYTPPSHSKKYPDKFIHNYDKKPLRVVSADGKTIMDLPGTHKVTDWIRG